MSEWWTYRPSSFLLFAPQTYYRLIQLYNETIWPMQIVAIAIAALLALLIWRGSRHAGRAAAITLAIAWAWIAWGFLWQRYATINWAAGYFAFAFALQAALLLVAGLRGAIDYRGDRSMRTNIGLAIFIVAIVLQPLIGPLLGRPWWQAEMLGLAPDPTAVATLGLIVAADRVRWTLMMIPLLWCALTGITLWTMSAPDAVVAPLLAAVAFIAAFLHRRPA